MPNHDQDLGTDIAEEEELERTPLSDLLDKRLSSIEDAPNNSIFLCGEDGKPWALVSRDDLFDPDGNRFEDDL